MSKKGGKSSGQNEQGGRRALHVRVLTAKKRTTSSQRWLARQLNDPYVAASKRDGYRSRAAYKLAEIDDRHRFLKRGMTVLDLGAAPGGWTQVAAARAGAGEGQGTVIALDLTPVEPIAGARILTMDFLAPEAPRLIAAALPDGKADVVLSDMASPATGHTKTDHIRIMALAEAAAALAVDVLKPGGAFLCKVLQGGTERELLELLRRDFRSVRHVKPPASRSDSAELYVLATGFRGAGG